MVTESLRSHWAYNCEDTVRTLECADEEISIIKSLGLEGPEAMQQSMVMPVLQAMIRGVRIDLAAREKLRVELSAEKARRLDYIAQVAGHPLNPASSKQMQAFFYTDLNQKVIFKRATKGKAARPTLDDDALSILGKREPILLPILKRIAEYRTIGIYLSTFIEATLDDDDRMRCSYNICGAETYRLASRESAFGTGTNLQTVPKGTGKSSHAKEVDQLELPNIRKLFIPDPGYIFFDGDLDRADLQVVVREIGDKDLQAAMEKGIDLHCMNACDIFEIKGIPYDELVETHPNYREHRGRISEPKRQAAKEGCHAANYGVGERTFSQQFGVTVREASRFIEKWFQAHPGIPAWHRDVEGQLSKRRFVTNKFGYRRFYFERIDGVLPQALAWIPQSTVGITVNKIWRAIYDTTPEVQVLLQVHDSLAGQFPLNRSEACKLAIQSASRIVIPYEDPLIIPFGLKTSPISWGDCK